MKKYFLLFCLYSLVSIPLTNALKNNSHTALFIAIAQGNTKQIDKILNDEVSINLHRDFDGNSPLMEAILALGEKLMEIEAESLANDISNPKNLKNDFRSFLRSFFVSLVIGISASEIENNIEKINNDDDHAVITILQSVAKSFLPVIARSAYIWCAYSILDYGILTGQKNSSNQSNPESNAIEKYKKNIDLLIAKHTINVNQVNQYGESALSMLYHYKNQLKTRELTIILYQIEQALLSEGAHSFSNSYSHAQN